MSTIEIKYKQTDEIHQRGLVNTQKRKQRQKNKFIRFFLFKLILKRNFSLFNEFGFMTDGDGV